MTSKRIRVLVIDDSAFARKVIREVLSKDSEIEVVGIARDGLEALEKIAELKPDVVTLDLIMPELDGLGVIKALPRESPPKVIVVSVSGSETELAIEALQKGAVDLVTKPTPLPTDRLYELATGLITKVKAAAIAHSRIDQAISSEVKVQWPSINEPLSSLQHRVIVIGTSTGGPHALTQFFRALPAQFPIPIAIALHIPAGYTAPLAARISQSSAVKLEEASEGMELKPGLAVIAPGGMHLRIKSREGKLIASVSRDPIDSLYHPSVDILFESAAEHVGPGALGIVLTGMGEDGMLGSKAIKQAKGIVLAESGSSCVVYGMPRAVIESGIADAQAPLGLMPQLLTEYIRSR